MRDTCYFALFFALRLFGFCVFFFFNDTATTEIYTLSLHDALPILWIGRSPRIARALQPVIQVVASFPAPMLFPLVILLFERIGVGLGLGAVALMVLAGQWDILFNVISAAAPSPQQPKDATTVCRLPWLAHGRSLDV